MRQVALGALAVGASYLAMRSPVLEERERALAVRVRRPRGPVVDRLVAAGTDLGSMYAVGGAAGVLAATRRRRLARDLLGAGFVAWAAAQYLKVRVGRPRPYHVEEVHRLVAEPSGTSWPSGHPAVAAAAATVLGSELPPAGRSWAAATAGFVALSRVYVGVHYPTDVIAGLGIGTLCGAALHHPDHRRER